MTSSSAPSRWSARAGATTAAWTFPYRTIPHHGPANGARIGVSPHAFIERRQLRRFVHAGRPE
jgi:hypothetical protein